MDLPKSFLSLILVLWLGAGQFMGLSPETPLKGDFGATEGNLWLVEGVYLKAIPVLPITGKILASKIETENLSILAEKIIDCESNGKSEVCNAEFGCNAGMGLFQLIPSTIKYCEQKLGKLIDPFNAEENKECGNWLLENEGWRHWGGPDTNWGSYQCFKDFIK